jgi:hypothetical protein
MTYKVPSEPLARDWDWAFGKSMMSNEMEGDFAVAGTIVSISIVCVGEVVHADIRRI